MHRILNENSLSCIDGKQCSTAVPQKIFQTKTLLEIHDELSTIEECEELCIAHAECEGFEYYVEQSCFLYKDISGEPDFDYDDVVGSSTCKS